MPCLHGTSAQCTSPLVFIPWQRLPPLYVWHKLPPLELFWPVSQIICWHIIRNASARKYPTYRGTLYRWFDIRINSYWFADWKKWGRRIHLNATHVVWEPSGDKAGVSSLSWACHGVDCSWFSPTFHECKIKKLCLRDLRFQWPIHRSAKACKAWAPLCAAIRGRSREAAKLEEVGAAERSRRFD